MKGYFTFHPVGLGQFYTGRIINDNTKEEINFIYDIGTIKRESIINDEVTKYCKETKKIDFVILSHLHKDHISGIYCLLNSGIKVDSIIMPYLNPTQLLFLFEEAISTINSKTIKSSFGIEYKQYYDSLFSFYTNPYSSIKKINNTCKVIVYSSTDISTIETLNGEPYYLRETNDPEDVLLKSFQNSNYIVKSSSGGVYSVCPKNTSKINYKGWMFDLKQPGANQINGKRINEMKQEIMSAMFNNTSKKDKKDMIKKINDYINNKDCITLEHYPLIPDSSNCHTLLMGDCDINEIYTPPNGQLSSGHNYYVIQIPHHGSKVKANLIINSKSEYSVVCHNKDRKKHPNNATLIVYGRITSNSIQHITEDSNSYFQYCYENNTMIVKH